MSVVRGGRTEWKNAGALILGRRDTQTKLEANIDFIEKDWLECYDYFTENACYLSVFCAERYFDILMQLRGIECRSLKSLKQ